MLNVGRISIARAFVAGAAFACVFGSGPAAAGGDLKQDYVPFSWSGFYAGLHAGAGWADADHAISGSPFWAGPGGSGVFSQELEGLIIGGQFGYNFSTGRWVYGIEATLSGGGTFYDHRSVSAFFPGSDRWSVDVDWSTTITGRLGYAFDRTLVYAKGGYAGAEVESRVFDRVFAVGGICVAGKCHAGEETWHHGWTVGAGVEHALWGNFIFGIEYNYIDLGRESHSSPTAAGAAGVGTVFLNDSVDLQIHTVTARLSVKFGL